MYIQTTKNENKDTKWCILMLFETILEQQRKYCQQGRYLKCAYRHYLKRFGIAEKKKKKHSDTIWKINITNNILVHIKHKHKTGILIR